MSHPALIEVATLEGEIGGHPMTVTTDQHGRAAATYEVGGCVLGGAVLRHGFAIAYLRYLTGRFEEPEAWRHRR